MASNRATKSGFAAEAQQKVLAKYDEGLAHELLEWIKVNTGEDFNTNGSCDNCYEILNDGYILAKLAKKFGANIPDRLLKHNTMQFKKMELVNMFLEAAGKAGVKDNERFVTVQLSERTDMTQVLFCIDSFSRKTGTRGVKESQANPRHFTQEQLNEGKKVVSLQYGTNQGATQAGMTMGKQRMIMD